MLAATGRSVTRERDVEWLAMEDDSDGGQPAVQVFQVEVSDAAATTRLQRIAAFGTLATVACLSVLHASGAASGRRGARLSSAVAYSEAGELDAERANAMAAQELAGSNTLAQAPPEDMHDGNVCADDEEEHMGLCYGKCSQLAGAEYPYRTSAWTCCKQSVCPPFQVFRCCSHNMGFCSGYDIAGSAEGEAICPHKPGVCLADEELFLEICYMKCAVLTGGTYPYRTGPASCCKKRDASCMFEDGAKDGVNGNAIMNFTLNVGGGCNDDKKSTHCKPHPPEESLTEA